MFEALNRWIVRGWLFSILQFPQSVQIIIIFKSLLISNFLKRLISIIKTLIKVTRGQLRSFPIPISFNSKFCIIIIFSNFHDRHRIWVWEKLMKQLKNEYGMKHYGNNWFFLCCVSWADLTLSCLTRLSMRFQYFYYFRVDFTWHDDDLAKWSCKKIIMELLLSVWFYGLRICLSLQKSAGNDRWMMGISFETYGNF